MNFSPICGFLFAILTLWITVISESPHSHALLEWKGLCLVVGGTLSAGLVIYPFRKLVDLQKFFIFAVLLKRFPKVRLLVREIIAAASLAPEERHLLAICPTSHPFLREGLKLIAENELNEKDLHEVLTRRSQYFKQSYLNDAKMLSTLAKFPASFGILGATVGLIDMLYNLGKNGHEVGPAMAMALVATFWGLVFTFMFFMPLSHYAVRLNAEDTIIRQLIVEGILMVKRFEPPRIVLDKLNGFLALHERLTLRNAPPPPQFWQQVHDEVSKIRRRAG